MGVQKAAIQIASDDPSASPFIFNISGTATPVEQELTCDSSVTVNGTLSAGQIKTYHVNVKPGSRYIISWEDICQQSDTGGFTCDIGLSAYPGNMANVSGYFLPDYANYFNDQDSGYLEPRTITAIDNIIYLKVAGYFPTSSGSYRLKMTKIPDGPVMEIKPGSEIKFSDNGAYDYGTIHIGSPKYGSFWITNTGNRDLNLSEIQIDGTDKDSFFVERGRLENKLAPSQQSNYFLIWLAPKSSGPKEATVSIMNDSGQNPFTFKVRGTVEEAQELSMNQLAEGYLAVNGDQQTYFFQAQAGKTYSIQWDDFYEGSGIYSSNIRVSAVHQDQLTFYFDSAESAYLTPKTITAQEDGKIYLAVTSSNSNYTGSYALEVSEVQ